MERVMMLLPYSCPRCAGQLYLEYLTPVEDSAVYPGTGRAPSEPEPMCGECLYDWLRRLASYRLELSRRPIRKAARCSCIQCGREWATFSGENREGRFVPSAVIEADALRYALAKAR